MSEENVEIVRRMYAAFHAGDAERALEYFDQRVVVDASRRVDGGTGIGQDDLTRIVGSWVGAFDQWREEIEEVRDLGNQVFVAATQWGKGKGSGIQTEARYALLYEIRGERISRMTMFSSPDEALEAAGLSE